MIQHVPCVMLGRGSDIRLRMTMKSRDDEEMKSVAGWLAGYCGAISEWNLRFGGC